MLIFVLLLTGLQAGKPLFRKAKDGRILNWAVNADDSFCTLQEAFQGVDPGVGFNIELKFVDDVVYEDEELTRSLRATLRVRRTTAPPCSKGGRDTRPWLHFVIGKRVEDLLDSNLIDVLGVVGTGVLPHQWRNADLRGCKEKLLGRGNQAMLGKRLAGNSHLMGVNGVIVDLVQEITEAVSEFISPDAEGDNKALCDAVEAKVKEASRPKFSQHELSFLLRLIPQLVQQQQ
ncbi:hypothetical protein GW17_00006263 [Ensete ventricosum]|nr:hypothetical protein GW17_00006263 [Ensete ventricosum]